MGDLHQPLHAGYLDDRGGNSYQVQYFTRGSNLHAVWDAGLIRHLDEAADAMAVRLAMQGGLAPWTPAQAAEESCHIVATEGFYPERRVADAYVQRFTPIMEGRLALAGRRLADLLNRSLR